MRPILFVVGTMTAYRIHKPFAEFCVSRRHRVQFVYDRPPDAFFEQIVADARRLGATAVSLDAAIAPGPHDSPWGFFNRPTPRAKIFEQRRNGDDGAKMNAFSDVIFGRLAAAKSLLKQIKPAVMVVAEDGVAGPLALITAAQASAVPVVVLPYGYGTERDFEIALEAKARRGELEMPEGPHGEAIKKFAPEWIKQGEFAGALLFPPEYIVALESAGMRLRNAWVVHGGTADRLLVESPHMLEVYRAEGLPPEKLVLTGSPYGDFVLEGLAKDPAARVAFRRPHRIDGRCRILVSWPPSYHDQRGDRSEFRTYAEMTEAVLSGLRRLPNTRVTVSIHPAATADQRDAVRATGADVSDEYVVRLIPRHDVYVSYYSSTIRWAVASGKPVLNYDAYQLGLDVYDQAPGVITTASIETLLQQAALLAGSDEAFGRLAKLQIDVASRWGMLDEPAMPRILAELEQLVKG